MNIKQKLFSISEACKEIGLINHLNGKTQTHTVRYWEEQFKILKPTMLSGRRYYSSKDLKKLELIKYLLKDQGLTIVGAKKILNNKIIKLDGNHSSSIKAEYLKSRALKILDKIKKIKWQKKRT